jgi:BMFP domain-containing protein YqiC
MEPLDEEARKISDALSSRWNHPIEGIDSQKSFGDALFEGLTRKLDSLVSKQIPISENMVSREEFDSLKEQLAQLMARNAELEEKSTRRV